ncbi:MAG TPA: hypothetical protein VK783_13200 [Bacteroidia bacterium]|jgi:hypothetical protein|nr:hypothetical protein [Bacteroidia bacterium]
MQKGVLLFSILSIFACKSHAQIRIGFGPPLLSTAQENEDNMAKLLKKSYTLPILYTGDSIPDTILLHEVSVLGLQYEFYCVRYKSDTNKTAFVIQKLDKDKGYKLAFYANDRVLQRSSDYDKHFMRSGDWKEYYPKGYIKVDGNYTEDKKDGTWKYYDKEGNKLFSETYKNGVLMSAKMRSNR